MAKSKKGIPRVTEEGGIYTYFGKNTQFIGSLEFERPLQINGRFQGEINSTGVLVIGEMAEIEANIKVATVIVGGHVIGNIDASSRVEMLANGKVNGNIRTPKLQIADGVIFEGNCEMVLPEEK